eukprot:PhM_4_TR4981/c0_g2_i1/m.30062
MSTSPPDQQQQQQQQAVVNYEDEDDSGLEDYYRDCELGSEAWSTDDDDSDDHKNGDGDDDDLKKHFDSISAADPSPGPKYKCNDSLMPIRRIPSPTVLEMENSTGTNNNNNNDVLSPRALTLEMLYALAGYESRALFRRHLADGHEGLFGVRTQWERRSVGRTIPAGSHGILNTVQQVCNALEGIRFLIQSSSSDYLSASTPHVETIYAFLECLSYVEGSVRQECAVEAQRILRGEDIENDDDEESIRPVVELLRHLRKNWIPLLWALVGCGRELTMVLPARAATAILDALHDYAADASAAAGAEKTNHHNYYHNLSCIFVYCARPMINNLESCLQLGCSGAGATLPEMSTHFIEVFHSNAAPRFLEAHRSTLLHGIAAQSKVSDFGAKVRSYRKALMGELLKDAIVSQNATTQQPRGPFRMNVAIDSDKNKLVLVKSTTTTTSSIAEYLHKSSEIVAEQRKQAAAQTDHGVPLKIAIWGFDPVTLSLKNIERKW